MRTPPKHWRFHRLARHSRWWWRKEVDRRFNSHRARRGYLAVCKAGIELEARVKTLETPVSPFKEVM
jgi:hypothetical protein